MSDTKKPDTTSDESETPVDKALETGPAPEGIPPEVVSREARFEGESSDPDEDARELEVITTEGEALVEADGMVSEELSEPEDSGDITDLARMDGTGPEAAEEPVADTPPPADPVREVEKETVIVERKAGAVPGFLGGAIAAVGLLFAAPYVIPPKFLPQNPEVRQAFETQAATIAALESEIEALQGQLADAATGSDLDSLKSAAEQGLADLSSRTDATGAALDALGQEISSGTAFSGLSALMEAMGARVDALEKRPIAEANDPASVAAVEAYGRELAELRGAVAAQMEDVDALIRSAAETTRQAVSKAVETSDAAVADAEAMAEAARLEAERAARAQALVDIRAALEEGRGYGDALSELDGAALPDALAKAAESGVSTLPELQEAFTLAARRALNASRSELSDGSATSRASTWLQNQVGLRSLTPSEGDDPDSVLSRADAALAEARLQDAISELSDLPASGQEAMAAWIALATARAEALAAANELAASLAAN